MGSAPEPPWEHIFSDLRKGDSKAKVCRRYGISRSTLYRRLIDGEPPSRAEYPEPTTPRPAPPPAQLTVLPGRTRSPEPQPRLTRAEKRRELVEQRSQAQAERIAEGAKAAGLSPQKLRESLQSIESALLKAAREGNARDIKDLSSALTHLSEKMGALLSVEEHFKAPEQTPDLSTPEGEALMVAFLNHQPALVSLCEVDVLEVALQRAREREKRQA
jgi:transposase-like protein